MSEPTLEPITDAARKFLGNVFDALAKAGDELQPGESSHALLFVCRAIALKYHVDEKDFADWLQEHVDNNAVYFADIRQAQKDTHATTH